MVKKSAAERKLDKQIEAAYYRNCEGMSIPIMRIGEVFKTFKTSLAKGNTFEQSTEDMVSFVKSIAE